MKQDELIQKSDSEIQTLWNELSKFFDKDYWQGERPKTVVIGFFQLSRETERRGLEIDKNKMGNIILKPKSK